MKKGTKKLKKVQENGTEIEKRYTKFSYENLKEVLNQAMADSVLDTS